MLSLLLCWLTVVTREKAHVAASASLEAPVCTDKKHYCVTGSCQESITTQRKGWWQRKQALCWLRPFTDRRKFLLHVIAALPFKQQCFTATCYTATQFNHLHTVSRPALAATQAFSSLVTTVNQCSGREGMYTPLFHLGKSQSTSCTRCSDLDRLSAR